MTPEERAARIAAELQGLRVEETLRCPQDGRRVAAVVIHDSERVLWVVGGRVERVRSTAEESATDLAETERRLAAEAGTAGRAYLERRAEWRRRHLSQLDDSGGIEIPPTAHPIAASGTSTTISAPCPRCHRDVRLTIGFDGRVSLAPDG